MIPPAPPPSTSISSPRLPKAPSFAESCVIQQRLTLGRLQAPVNVIPARKAKPGVFSRLQINSLLSGCQRHGGARARPRVPGLHPTGMRGWSAPSSSQPTACTAGDSPAASPGGAAGWQGLNQGCLVSHGDPGGVAWLLATTLNFPQAAVRSSTPPQIQLAFLLSHTPKFLCFKPLCKARRITGSTMVVTQLAGAKDLYYFFLALESNLAVPCTAGI